MIILILSAYWPPRAGHLYRIRILYTKYCKVILNSEVHTSACDASGEVISKILLGCAQAETAKGNLQALATMKLKKI